MQKKNVPINPPATSLNPIKDAVGVSAVGYSADLDNLYKKSENLENFYKTGKANGALISSSISKTTLSRSTKRNNRKKSIC